MRVTVCFQFKKTKSRLDGKYPLYLWCTLNGQRFEISTGFFLDSETWIESKQQVKGRIEEAKTINNRLDKIRTKVQDVYNQLESMGQPYNIFSIKNKFLGHINGKEFIEIFDWVIIDRTKTESRCRIPLLHVANEILKKYETHPVASSSNRLLPV